jgi:hypothetical protein
VVLVVVRRLARVSVDRLYLVVRLAAVVTDTVIAALAAASAIGDISFHIYTIERYPLIDR